MDEENNPILDANGKPVEYNPYNTRDMVVATMGHPNQELIARAYVRASGRVAIDAGINLNGL